ncbi:ParB N-terminal domain-containing protein [Aquabacterium sp.]|uniref:ParB N-terminal domain-containing protein n=1 Tax=Aquabacterium sp. TaxID=1872578 RepID=UPI0025C4F709|nr:ParB N-terminal domain-containing protein [Aquabacterium sp.]
MMKDENLSDNVFLPFAAPSDGVRCVHLSDIIQDQSLQVRGRLSDVAIRQYAAALKAGSMLPPVSLADIDGRLFLLDGWHRVAAHRAIGEEQVDATVSIMTRSEAAWVAADANRRNGVPLKAREYRAVFNAYVGAGMHRIRKGKYKSYRDMGRELGVSFSTLRNWMKKDHPSIYEAMGDRIPTEGNPEPSMTVIDPQPGYLIQAKASTDDAYHHADLLMCPRALGEAIANMERRLSELKLKPHEVYTEPEENPNF